jgi:hypothetical protein
MRQRSKVPSAVLPGPTLEIGEAAIEVLLADGGRKGLTEADRRDLLMRVRAGEHVELSFRARTYVQSEASNRNFVRFKESILKRFAKSFAGQVFLRDHSQHAIDDRGGTIVSSELVADGDGTSAIEMEIRAVKPWAVEGLLDRTIDRFSIGWHPGSRESVLCSAHKKALFGKDGCFCRPGDKVGEEVVEAIFTVATGVEVSAVNVPAVPEARGVEIQAALSAWSEECDADAASERTDMKTIATLCGLAAAASEEEILSAIGRLKDDRDALKERAEATKIKLDALEAERNAATAAALETHVEARIRELKSTGALPVQHDADGVSVLSGSERALRAAAKRGGREEFDSVAADYAPGTFSPVGQKRQSSEPAPDKAAAGKHPLLSNPEVLKQLKAAGVDPATADLGALATFPFDLTQGGF